MKVFSSIDLFMDKPTNVRVKRAIKAFYKAKGVKHEDWLEKANRLTMKEFKAICLSKSLPEHGAYPLMDLYSIARFKHEDIRVWFDRIQKIQTTLANFVGFNQIGAPTFMDVPWCPVTFQQKPKGYSVHSNLIRLGPENTTK